MQLSVEIDELAKGLVTYREKLEQPSKDKTVDANKYKYSYATLDAITKAIDNAIVGTGITYIQSVSTNANEACVKTIIMHTSGQFIETDTVSLPASRKDAQAFGSAITYAKRYSLCAAFGVVADEDDDGSLAKDKAPDLATDINLSVLKNKIIDFSKKAGCSEESTWASLQKSLGVYNDMGKLTSEECALMLQEIEKQLSAFKKA